MMSQIGIILAVLFVVFVFFEDAFLRPTDDAVGTIKEVNFTYQGAKTLSYEKALLKADDWYVDISLNSDEYDSSYRCDITKAQFSEMNTVFNKYKGTGPVPVTVHITHSYIFDASRCDSTADINLNTFIKQEVAKATVTDLFYYYGESVETATAYEVDVTLHNTEGKLLGTTGCPVDKVGYESYREGDRLLARLDKNINSDKAFPYVCHSLFAL